MSELFGNSVRFGAVLDGAAAGEGVETMLSLKSHMPMVAAFSAAHLAALLLPATLRRLYVAADNDAAGRRAATRLMERARGAKIEAHLLLSRADDCGGAPWQVPLAIAAETIPRQKDAAEALCVGGRAP